MHLAISVWPIQSGLDFNSPSGSPATPSGIAPRTIRAVAVAAVMLCLNTATATACDTPVFRYAMYSWPAGNYHVVYLYEKQIARPDEAVLDALRNVAADANRPANVVPHAFDLADEAAKAELPSSIRKQLHDAADLRLPQFFILTPRDEVLSTIHLTADEVSPLVDSPARRRLVSLLDEGHSGVLLLLEGTDRQKARHAVEEAVRRAAEGEIAPASLPGIAIEDLGASKQRLDVGLLVIDRNDPREVWFVRQLLSVEPDLASHDESMVFPVYGRGRAMEPYVGEGIVPDNLAEAIAFMSGACSCEVKELNPGMDMLLRCDWEATAAKMADLIGDEEGNQDYLGVEELLPAVVGAGDSIEQSLAFSDAKQSEHDLASAAVSDLSPELPAMEADTGSAEAESLTLPDTSLGDTVQSRMLKNLTIGAGLGFVALVVASFVIFRVRAAG